MSQRKGIAFLIITTLLWSTAGVFIKLIHWNALVIGGFRSAIAAAVIWIVLCLREGKPCPIISRNTLLTGLFLGGTTVLFVMANKLTTAANAIVLQSISPVFVLIFEALSKRQRPSRRDLFVVGVVCLGVFLFFIDDLAPGSLLGNVLGLISGASLACAYLFAAGGTTLHETMSGVFLGHCFSTLVGVPFLFLYPPEFTPVAVGAVLFLGIFQLGISYTLFAYAARVCKPLAISLVGMLEPVFSPIWVAIFIREVPGPLAIFGGVMVIVTLFFWGTANAKRHEATQE